MKNIGNIIKTLQNIMRKDPGVSGDAQRIEQLGWMISLKILDDKDKEIELLNDKYVSPMPKKLQWRNWAADDEGMTGDELKEFIESVICPEIQSKINDARQALMRFDLETAKRSYIEVLRLYNNMTSEEKVKVYHDIKELYSERKSAEELKV